MRLCCVSACPARAVRHGLSHVGKGATFRDTAPPVRVAQRSPTHREHALCLDSTSARPAPDFRAECLWAKRQGDPGMPSAFSETLRVGCVLRERTRGHSHLHGAAAVTREREALQAVRHTMADATPAHSSATSPSGGFAVCHSTVRLLVASAGRGATELLRLAAAGVGHEEGPVVLEEELLDLVLLGLVDVCEWRPGRGGGLRSGDDGVAGGGGRAGAISSQAKTAGRPGPRVPSSEGVVSRIGIP